MYIAEVSPAPIRGRLVGIYEIGVQAGTYIGFWISYGVSLHISWPRPRNGRSRSRYSFSRARCWCLERLS